MKRHTTLEHEIRRILLMSALVAGVSLPLFAQDQPSAEPETIVVTGSRIRRTDEGALPVQVITQQQIQATGAATAEQFLQTLSIAVQGNTNVVSATGSGATTGGVSSVSLRGLGSQRTLVLVNGRRVSGGGTITDSTSVDINSIPLAAVERVEVLKEGASAVYGSDAIAGVVNFILRQNYDGAQLTAYGGGTSDGGGGIKKGDGIIGFGDLPSDRYNVLFVASYHKENPLFGAQRNFAQSGINVAANNDVTSGNAFPANVVAADGTFGSRNPQAGNCAPSVTSPLFPPTVCRFDPSPFVSLLPDTERYGLYLAGRYQLTDDIQLYADATFNHNRQRFVIQPVPISDQFVLPPSHPLFNVAPYNGAETILLQPSSPFYPTALVTAQTGGATPDLLVRYRSTITGNRDLTDTSKQPRANIGVKGDINGWGFDGGVLYSETKLTEHDNGGYPALSQILPLFNSGQVNFFGPNSPAITSQALATNFVGDAYTTKTSMTSVLGSVTKDVWTLPAGPLAGAFGAEWRKEKFSSDPSPIIQSGDISGYGGNFLPVDVSRNVEAVFAELNIPIIKSLEGGVAVRWDHYQNTGSKTVPQARLRWRPIEQVLVRGSWGKGFRAPSLTELFSPQVTGVSANGLNDPARCGVTAANGVVNTDSRDCATQFPIVSGGNTQLQPESSKNYTLGVVYEPTTYASFGLDAFKINLKNTIIFGVQPDAILANTAQFGNLVTRGPPDPGTPGLPGHITNIEQVNLNFGETRVEGVDADFRYRIPTDRFGDFKFNLTGSYFWKYDVENPDGTFQSINGRVSPIVNGNGGVVPRWHHYVTANWTKGPWDATVDQNYQSSYLDIPGTFEDPTTPGFQPRRVSVYRTYDLQLAYTGIEHARIAVGAKDIFNQTPPYTNAGGQNYFQAGYDPGYVDPRGRFIYGQIAYSFR
jgi:iron complex outermembrane receptor protein